MAVEWHLDSLDNTQRKDLSMEPNTRRRDSYKMARNTPHWTYRHGAPCKTCMHSIMVHLQAWCTTSHQLIGCINGRDALCSTHRLHRARPTLQGAACSAQCATLDSDLQVEWIMSTCARSP